MLMDLLRIENFMKDHACHVDDKAAKLNDMVVYADFVKGKYQSVFEQLQVDIEVEKLMMHLKMFCSLRTKIRIWY